MSWPKGQLVFMYGGNKKETSTPFELELCGNKPISYIYTNRKRRISQDINCKEQKTSKIGLKIRNLKNENKVEL